VGSTGLVRHRSRVADRLRVVLAGSGLLRRAVRIYVGLEDRSGVPADAAESMIASSMTLIVAEELGADERAAISAAAAVALVYAAAQIRDDARFGDPAQAINAGDLAFALAFGEAAAVGEAVLRRVVGAAVEQIERRASDGNRHGTARAPEGLVRCAFAAGGLVAGAPDDVMCSLDRIGPEVCGGRTESVLSACRRIGFSEEGANRVAKLCAALPPEPERRTG